MRIVCIGYRDWALRIYSRLQHSVEHEVIIVKSDKKLDYGLLYSLGPDLVLFYGWSWTIPVEILKQFKCLMLHPSDLPKFRGGSPIQNQILSGVNKSKITIFQMTEEIDAGPIIIQKPIDLSGSMIEIFTQMENLGLEATLAFLADGITYTQQNDDQATYHKRRTPAESEITWDEFKTSSARQIHDKIRSLQDPYPNAFIRMADGSKLILKQSQVED